MRGAGAGDSAGELDRLIFPEASLDVLAQQIVACCAASGERRRRTANGNQSTDDEAGEK
jgi:hypothetical protein